MRKFLKVYENPFKDRINLPLIKRKLEGDLSEFVINVFKSLETIPSITFLDYSIERDESKIDYSKYITSRRRKKKKEEDVSYMYIKSDRTYEVKMTFKISVRDKEKIIKKSILLPKMDANNYITLKDKKFFLLYQLLDSSTYVVKNGITLKSLMPIVVKYNKNVHLEDVHGNNYDIVTYYMKVFKRDINILLFFFCKFGVSTAIRYFKLNKVIKLIKVKKCDKDDDKNLYFPINKHFAVKVNKTLFKEEEFISTFVGMIYVCFANSTNEDDIDNQDYWLEELGSLYTNIKHKKIASGLSTMLFFERLLDQTTKETMKISPYNKRSIYAIIKWMIENFSDLKSKNNMNLNTKRLRLFEYIASMLSLKLGDGISRVLSYGSKVDINQIETNIFKFPGTIVIQALTNSQLLKFDDRCNDLDFFSALRYTVKGPNSIGGGSGGKGGMKSERNISVKYRGVHPTYLGNLDINVYSSSNPGLNGSLSPFAHTNGLYFNDEPEPQDTEYRLFNKIESITADDANEIKIKYGDDTPISYYNCLNKLSDKFGNIVSIEIPEVAETTESEATKEENKDK